MKEGMGQPSQWFLTVTEKYGELGKDKNFSL